MSESALLLLSAVPLIPFPLLPRRMNSEEDGQEVYGGALPAIIRERRLMVLWHERKRRRTRRMP